ncbi:hypothetical protein [Bradyrhizobium sp.]|uniref:hypothetical protein n=1 Tax=Bradyrhizobium sp. TaxID=376 RepID=UPI003D149CEF
MNQAKGPFSIKKIDSRIRCCFSGTPVKVAAWFLASKKEHAHANSLWRHRYPYLPEMQKFHAPDEAHTASIAGRRFRKADFYLPGLPL